MPSIVRALPGSFSTIASSGLNSLAANTGVLSIEFDNSQEGARWPFATFELVIDWDTTPPTVGRLMIGYILPSLDGTNYPDANVTAVQSNPAFEFVVAAATTVQRLSSPVLAIPPCKFKVFIVNDTDQTTSGSGTAKTLGILPHTTEISDT